MSSLIAPRYELPVIDSTTGRMSREWYKFLVLMAKSVGTSGSSTDDLQLLSQGDASQAESLAVKALKDARDAANFMLLSMESDLPKPVDLSLLAWWPGDQK